MKYALIGCGRIAPNHLEAAINNNLDIVGLCDILDEHIDVLLEKVGVEKNKYRRYTDYKEMLEKERPKLVAIATESGKHAQIALDCLDYGANVIIEKPIALSLKDADAIINKAKEKGLVVCANHQNRFNKSIQKIRSSIEAGDFGRLFYGTAHIRWNREKDYYTQAPWRGTWAQDGGSLMNQCIHNIDLLRWMLGDDIVEVTAYTDNLNHDYIEAEDLGIALVKFKNGAYGIIEGTTDIYPKNLEETLYLFGEKGTVKAGGKSVNILEEWIFEGQEENAEKIKEEYSEMPKNIYGFGHTPLYKNVIEAINNNTKPLVDAEAGRRALELVLAIYKSAKEGRPVKLPLEDTSTMDFVGRFDK